MVKPSLAARLGLAREQDLLLHLPLRFEDHTRIAPVASLRLGEHAQVQGRVIEAQTRGAPPRRVLVVTLEDAAGGRFSLRFLHFWPSQVTRFARGRWVRAQGEVRGGLFGLEMVHPSWQLVGPDDPLPERLTPIYPTVAGVGQERLRVAVSAALTAALTDESLSEVLPQGLLDELQMLSLAQALRELHQPAQPVLDACWIERQGPAWRRLIFDELLAQQLSLRRARLARAALSAPPLADDALVQRLRQELPFALTAAQERAYGQIAADLALSRPMHRLLQGDVGSGKTAVAALAAMQAVGSGWQVALMAPTELLAEQHLRKLGPWLEPMGVRLQWLVGSMRESARRQVREAVAAGDCDVLVGTHALIGDSLIFARLGLVIVDEQHRFGVGQRLALRDRGEGDSMPHQLMMSATPIPRTLAMSYYADLEVSVIDELPPGRRPVRTRLFEQGRRDELIARMKDAVAAGRQVYWVCPLVEESAVLDLQHATATRDELQAALEPVPVGLVHGRLPAAERQAEMASFAAGQTRVLVATTVIEVGVDVPAASLMVIEHAERFGLAQLHQLRGRVGRGGTDSDCVLLYKAPLSVAARERLKAIFESTDGFEIARRDLAQRGPGELLGLRQSGQLLLRYADLERDQALVEVVGAVADRMLAEQPSAADEVLDRWLGGRDRLLAA